MPRKIVSGAKGKQARLFIGTTEFCAEDWDIQEVGDEEDTTNTCSAGQAEQEIGVTRLEGTINYTWDILNNPFDTPPNLAVGAKHPNSKLYVNATGGQGLEDGPYWEFTLQVLGHQNSLPVRGKVTGVINFASYGSYTLPSGDLASSGA